LFTAGAESPAASLWYTLSHLSRNKEVSAKVIAEADAFFAKHDEIDDMTIDDLNDLPYIKNVVLEGLRRFAPATKVQRGCVEEVTVGGYKWPAGTNFGICIESVNRDNSAWADPTSFSPERYDTPVPGNNRFTYATFSHGKRGCPGRATTVLQMQVLLVNLFRRFTLAPTAGDEQQDIETRPCVKKWVRWDVGGHTLLIQPRTPTVSSQAA
jgi:cytochrome P450